MHRGAGWIAAMICGAALILQSGCGGGSGSGDSSGRLVIRVDGSDTMLNLAQAWAEEYSKAHPDVSVQVSGGGSGVGIAALIDGVADMANASRKMKAEEVDLAKQNTGQEPREFIVGLDALAVYVHKDNPIEAISIEELAEVYGDGGKITKWNQLGVRNTGCKTDEITRVSRQSSSGTYHYFREAVLGENADYKLGSINQSGSKDVVALVARTPCAIGYSGMGYKTDDVKWLKIARKKGEQGIAPSVEAAQDGSYLIARPLHIYTAGEPQGHVQEYLDWILSPEGQQVVRELGYVPINASEAVSENAAADPSAEAEATTGTESGADPAAEPGTPETE